MNRDRQEKEKAESDKGRRKRLRRGAIALIVAGVVLCLLSATVLYMREDVDAKLAAIEAARAIPDEENAALVYDRLMQDFGSISVPQGIVVNATDTTTRKPWLTKDNPQLAAWINQQQPLIDGLLQAAEIPQCRFPLAGYPEKFHQRLSLAAVRGWMFMVARSANNDVAEGRIDSAIAKHSAMMKMAAHLCQQPVMADYLVGIAIEAFIAGRLRSLVVTAPCTEAHLKAIEAAMSPLENQWDIHSPQMAEVDRLWRRKEPRQLLRWIWEFWANTRTLYFERAHEQYLRVLSYRRGMRILIALRRYKNETGQWPQTLDDVAASLPAEALLDPLSSGPFVYRLTDQGFTLYSKGPNKLDEDGIRKPALEGGPDDQPIWP